MRDLYNKIDSQYEEVVNRKYRRLLEDADRALVAGDNQQNREQDKEAERLRRQAHQFRNRALANPLTRQRIMNQAKGLIEEEINHIWPKVNLYKDYYSLLKDNQQLYTCGKGILKNEEHALLITSKPDDGSIDLEDIPALLYMFLLLEGYIQRKIDHIVIDEAQDFSPLHFRVLKEIYPEAVMTIVGDIDQGIYGHRGLNNWEEILPLFEQESLQFENIYQNYRSTHEIVEFNNRVKMEISNTRDFLPAKPFNRPGAIPKIILSTNQEILFQQIASDIKSLVAENITQIGVIVKTDEDSMHVLHNLHLEGVLDAYKISNRDTKLDFEGGIVVLPVALAKGIEFQAAFVFGVSRDKYRPEIEYDRRLLYVAVTRALHFLNLYSSPPLSPLLETAKDAAEIVYIK